MALEQTIKDLQAQNALFQEMFTNLAEGQKYLKDLIIKKKNKNIAGILNMGKRFRGPVKVVRQLEFLEKSGETEGSVKADEGSHHESQEEEEEEYMSEQYPPDNEKYKQLEDRLNAVENLKMSGLKFDT